MFTIEYVKNLQWENAEHTIFSCTVKYEEFNEEHPSGVNATDPYPHIHEIWVNALEGKYGSIKEYEPPQPQPIPTPTAQRNKERAIQLLNESDWTATSTISDPAVSNPYLTNQAEFLSYRNALREIAVNPQEGFITFPTKPNEVWSS